MGCLNCLKYDTEEQNVYFTLDTVLLGSDRIINAWLWTRKRNKGRDGQRQPSYQSVFIYKIPRSYKISLEMFFLLYVIYLYVCKKKPEPFSIELIIEWLPDYTPTVTWYCTIRTSLLVESKIPKLTLFTSKFSNNLQVKPQILFGTIGSKRKFIK